MKRKILYIAFTAVISMTAFFTGKLINTSTEPTHIQKMEYAFRNVEYWEITDTGLDIYDYDGNLYRWR